MGAVDFRLDIESRWSQSGLRKESSLRLRAAGINRLSDRHPELQCQTPEALVVSTMNRSTRRRRQWRASRASDTESGLIGTALPDQPGRRAERYKRGIDLGPKPVLGTTDGEPNTVFYSKAPINAVEDTVGNPGRQARPGGEPGGTNEILRVRAARPAERHYLNYGNRRASRHRRGGTQVDHRWRVDPLMETQPDRIISTGQGLLRGRRTITAATAIRLLRKALASGRRTTRLSGTHGHRLKAYRGQAE